MQLSQHRELMAMQSLALRLLAGNEEDVVAFEHAQWKLFRSIENGTFDPVEESLACTMRPVEMQAEAFAASETEEWFNLTDLLPVATSTSRLAGRFRFATVSGPVQVVCRYYDYQKQLIAIDFPPLQDNAFCTPVPVAAHHVAVGLVLGGGARASVESLGVAGIMPDTTPIDPDNLAVSQNDVARSFSDNLSKLVARIPDSNGSVYYKNARRPHVGIITDDFMFNYYANALDLEYLTPEGYAQQLESGKFDFVFYVTCWLGMRGANPDGSFEYHPSKAVEIVPAVFKKARELGIPALFQSIEDPPSYYLFLNIAQAADVIFTSAVEMIPKYVRDTGNPLVFYQPYGVNPAMHNPIGCMKKYSLEPSYYRNSVFFAGSWYGAYRERCVDTALLFDTLVRGAGKNLVIADRTLHFERRRRRAYPAEYNEFIVEPIEHQTLQKVHKLFDFAINLNTIKDSETMGAMRVYEVQALGSLLVSNQSKSLENVFPDVFEITEKSDAKAYFDNLTQAEIVRRILKGVRRILSDATVYDRLNTMFLHANLPVRYEKATVHVFADPGDGLSREAFSRQTYAWKELHPLSELDGFDCSQGFFATMTSPYPSDHFLEDAMNAFKYTDVSYVQALPFERYADSFDFISGTPDMALSVFSSKEKMVRCMDEGRREILDGFAIVSI